MEATIVKAIVVVEAVAAAAVEQEEETNLIHSFKEIIGVVSVKIIATY